MLKQLVGSFALAACQLTGTLQARPLVDYVDLELILAVDVSRSMNSERLTLQRRGYVAAFRDPQVSKAIQSGPQGRIAVTYVEWSGADRQSILIPWRVISSPDDAKQFAVDLERQTTSRTHRTSISSMLYKAKSIFAQSGMQGLRRVVDVSGDGPNNSGPPVTLARDALIDHGIVINGLPIIAEPDALPGYYEPVDLEYYYRDCVIGGPGSFYVPVVSMQNFAKAIRMKLILEIANRSPANRAHRLHKAQFSPAANSRGRADCMVGQRLEHHRMPKPKKIP